MRYDDASEMGSFTADQAEAPAALTARNDVDVILAGLYGPATGNAITGSGTISGIAGADMVAGGATITAIQGAGGTDTSFSGGKLQIAGEHGFLTIDAQGNYSYVRNQGSPNGVSDVFSYTLSNRAGGSDIANLTINIGKTPTVVQANAVQVVPGPDGVVTLPEGVQLSDIHVVGRNLVIDMPDGTQMIIVDGAVFVPQLVLGTVEVPSTNLAALLIDSEPTPASGPPQSSGGNFAVPVAPLDPGAPLGDLIPPTVLSYTPPEFNELANAVEEDEPVLITDLTPAISGGDVLVDEDDLLASRGVGESVGSDTSKELLTVAGTFTLIAPDGVEGLTVGSLNVIVNGTFQAGATLTTPLGNTLTITGYNATTGVVSYTYTLVDNEAHANGAGENSLFEDFLVTLTDEDGDVDTDTLSVNIVDDIPTANDDVAGLLFGGPISVTVDVDTNDIPGADGMASRLFTSLTGTYGNLVVNPDGTQTYTLTASGIVVMNNLPTGQTLTDTFTYTLTDGDGDSDPANLVVTLTGGDDPVLITNLTPAAQGGDAIVDEDDLPDGSDTSKESLTVNGNFTISAPDGVNDLTVGGFNVIVDGIFQAGSHVTPLGNTLTFISYVGGVVSYTYTLNDNETHPNANGQNSIFEDFAVSLTDNDGDLDTDTLSVQIVDDIPAAENDAFAILEGDADNAITFDVDLNDVPGADGTASRNFTTLAGTYGNLTLNGDGTQTYTLNAVGVLAINALPPGSTLNDSFTYTLTDGDGDSDPATLVITLTGTDDPPLITNLTPAVNGGDVIVDEDDLADGSDTSKESLTVSGDFTISAPDGVNDLSVGGFNVIIDGVFQAGSGGLTPLGNTITFTGYDAATGIVSYSYTLNDNEAHANANGQNSLFEDLAVILSDTDNDVDTDTLSIQIVDDVPTAANDSVGQVTENSSVTFGVFGNDSFGADGVDTDNNPVVAVTFTQPPAGQGTVSYNAGTGQFTFVPAAGQQGSTSFTYTIIDGDGDPSTATVTINLQPDSVPIVTAAVAAVDDDGLAGGNPASVTGDLDANAGEVPLSASEATYNGTFVANFGGDTGTFSLAAMHGTSGSVGTETVNYTYAGNVLTATGPRGVLFTVTVNPATGQYTVQLVDNVLHAAADNENDATAALTFTASDSDGDSTNGTLTITFDDDAPTLGTIQNGTANNNPASAPSVGTLHLAIGADSPAVVTAIGLNPTLATSGGKALVTNFSGNTLTAYQDANGNGVYDALTDTTTVFTLTINPNAGSSGQYVFDLVTPLDPTVTSVPIGGSAAFGAGPTGFQVLLGADAAQLAVVTGYNTGVGFNAAAWQTLGIQNPPGLTQDGVNGSTAGWGISNNNYDTGEFFNWDFGSGALDDPDGPGGYVPPDATVELPNISVATFDFINYTNADDIRYVVHYTDGSFDSGAIPDANLDGADWTFTADAGKFIADIEMYNVSGGGKVDLVSVGVQSTNLNTSLGFTVSMADADGDVVNGGFSMNIATTNSPSTPEAAIVSLLADEDFSSLGVMSSDTQQEQQQKTAANNNTVMIAALAAGVVAAPVAAESEDQSSTSEVSAPMLAESSGSEVADDGDGSRSALDNETKEAAGEEASDVSGGASSSSGEPAGGHSLTADNDQAPESQPAKLLDATDAPASQSAESIIAPMVAMPSAEALIAAQLEASESEGSQSNAVVGKVLVDALEGGGAEASVDALLEALPAQGLGGNAAVEALASQPAANVSAWDSGHLGGYAAGQNFTMEAVALHHDAVQPVANG